jgi:hypothetical protein
VGPDNESEAIRGIQAALDAIDRRLAHVEMALEQIGLRACRHCNRFFRRSEPGLLFDCRGPVCVECIQEWWAQLSTELIDRTRNDGTTAHAVAAGASRGRNHSGFKQSAAL